MIAAVLRPGEGVVNECVFQLSRRSGRSGGCERGDGGLPDADPAVVRRHVVVGQHGDLPFGEAGLDDLGEPGVLEDAAGQCDRIEAVPTRRRRRRLDGRPAERLVEARCDHPAAVLLFNGSKVASASQLIFLCREDLRVFLRTHPLVKESLIADFGATAAELALD